MTEHPNYICHLFICTHTKEKGNSCGPKGGANLRAQLKQQAEEKYPELKGKFRINASGCLGQCEKGITAVMYPQGHWRTHIKSEDLPNLLRWVDQSLSSD